MLKRHVGERTLRRRQSLVGTRIIERLGRFQRSSSPAKAFGVPR